MGTRNLLEELEQLTNPAPLMEDDYDGDEATSARVVDKAALLEEDQDDMVVGRVAGQARILAEEDDRYDGVVVTRAAMGHDQDVEMSGEEEDQEEEEGIEDEEEGDEDDEDEMDGSEGDQDEGLVRMLSKVDVADDRAKGRAVAAQIRLWEQLLGARIRFQRILPLINQLPQTTEQWERATTGDQADNYEQTRGLLESALDDILAVQQQLLSGRADEVVSSPDDQGPRHLDNYSALLAERRRLLTPFRDQTIAKWFEKTRLATGRLTAQSFAAFEKDHSQRIEHILSDRDRVIKRTRLKRSTYSIIGKSDNNEDAEDDREYDEEIFDDDDFYQQLLRELIERRTAGVSDPVMLSRQWLEMQKLRNKSKKKRVDRKASKGRRCRYDVVAKLVNFMAPIDRCPINDQTRDELFGSLFKSTA